MRFVAGKDDLLNGIRIVERATVVKGLQPVLANVLIETVGTSQIKLTATDFDLSITTLIDAQVEEEGRFTLPAKKLGEIISRLQDELVKIELNGSTATITCKKSKFDIIGISASEFPQVEENISEEDSIEIDTKPFTKAIRQVVSAAAGYETNNLLSGVVCEVNKNILEMAATDGNRLARVREVVKNNSVDSEKVDRIVVIKGYDQSDAIAKKLAQAIQEVMKPNQDYQIYTRKTSAGGEYYGVLRGAKAGNVDNRFILEHSFHSNKKMAEWLYQDENIKLLAQAEAKAIADIYNYKKEAQTGIYKVITDTLNIRAGAGTSFNVVGQVKKGDAYTITETKGNWGLLKSEVGWINISSKYCQKIK